MYFDSRQIIFYNILPQIAIALKETNSHNIMLYNVCHHRHTSLCTFEKIYIAIKIIFLIIIYDFC